MLSNKRDTRFDVIHTKPVRFTVQATRPHREYTKDQRKATVEYASKTSIALASLAYDIPQSTIRTWVKQEVESKRLLKGKLIHVIIASLGFICLGLLGVVGIAFGVTYLYGGSDEVGFLWQVLTNLVR